MLPTWHLTSRSACPKCSKGSDERWLSILCLHCSKTLAHLNCSFGWLLHHFPQARVDMDCDHWFVASLEECLSTNMQAQKCTQSMDEITACSLMEITSFTTATELLVLGSKKPQLQNHPTHGRRLRRPEPPPERCSPPHLRLCTWHCISPIR